MTTLAPEYRAASIALSGGNLVATQTNTGSAMVLANTSSAAGNADSWYFEVTVNSITPGFNPGSDIGVGISSLDQNLNVDFNENSIGYHSDGWMVIRGIGV